MRRPLSKKFFWPLLAALVLGVGAAVRAEWPSSANYPSWDSIFQKVINDTGTLQEITAFPTGIVTVDHHINRTKTPSVMSTIENYEWGPNVADFGLYTDKKEKDGYYFQVAYSVVTRINDAEAPYRGRAENVGVGDVIAIAPYPFIPESIAECYAYTYDTNRKNMPYCTWDGSRGNLYNTMWTSNFIDPLSRSWVPFPGYPIGGGGTSGTRGYQNIWAFNAGRSDLEYRYIMTPLQVMIPAVSTAVDTSRTTARLTDLGNGKYRVESSGSIVLKTTFAGTQARMSVLRKSQIYPRGPDGQLQFPPGSTSATSYTTPVVNAGNYDFSFPSATIEREFTSSGAGTGGTSSTIVPGCIDIGLRLKEKNNPSPSIVAVTTIPAWDTPTNIYPLRIKKGEPTQTTSSSYSIQLVDVDDPAALSARIRLANGQIKALGRCGVPVAAEPSRFLTHTGFYSPPYSIAPDAPPRQHLGMRNTTGIPISSFRATLVYTDAKLLDPNGYDSQGRPYIQYNLEMAPFQEVKFTAEFDPATGAGGTWLMTPADPDPNPKIPKYSVAVPIKSQQYLGNGRYEIVFPTEFRTIYGFQYSDDGGTTWRTAGRMISNPYPSNSPADLEKYPQDPTPRTWPGADGYHWIDEGPPRTSSPPTAARKYKVWQMPSSTKQGTLP